MKIVALSDTHLFRPEIPEGDVLIHAGDLGSHGDEKQLCGELEWLAAQPHKRKLYVPGNHDQWADVEQEKCENFCAERGIIMLVDTAITIDGVKFYGYPWTPIFGYTQAFMREKDELCDYATSIPDCDVLISHGPPKGILDLSPKYESLGCTYLRERIKELDSMRLHIFGHIHAGGGLDIQTTRCRFANVAYCLDERKGASYRPIFTYTI